MTLHTLRHTALSRMVASGFDDYTVMAICWALVDADARALHAPHRRAKDQARSNVTPMVTSWAQSRNRDRFGRPGKRQNSTNC